MAFSSNKNKELLWNTLIEVGAFNNIREDKLTIVKSKFDKLKSMWSVSPSYADKISEVSCNDCLKKSNIPYHPKYNKCSHCRSYNTNFLRSLN